MHKLSPKRIRFSYRQRLLFKRIQYAIQRHPVPLSGREWAVLRSSPRVLLNSFPKAGTNLLASIFCGHAAFIPRWLYHLDDGYVGFAKQLRSQRRGQVLTLHSKWNDEFSSYLKSSNQKMIFIIRDPRDIAVSNFHYILKDRSHRLHHFFRSLPDSQACLRAAIAGISSNQLGGSAASLSLREHTLGYMGWLKEKNCHIVSFEKLTGSDEGGSMDARIICIQDMFSYAGFELSRDEARLLVEQSTKTKTRTFRKGKSGEWRSYLTGDIKSLVKDQIGDLLIELGYEDDMDW